MELFPHISAMMNDNKNADAPRKTQCWSYMQDRSYGKTDSFR